MDNNYQNQNHTKNEHQGILSITVAAERPADSQEVPRLDIERRDVNSIWRFTTRVTVAS